MPSKMKYMNNFDHLRDWLNFGIDIYGYDGYANSRRLVDNYYKDGRAVWSMAMN